MLLTMADQMGVRPAAIALAWLIRKPWVSSVIFGARSLEQLEANLRALSVVLSDDQMQRLDQISAPEWGYPYDFIRNTQSRW
jgi:aryl-alcohol dehydrogenase-like predicted oxidoreductase